MNENEIPRPMVIYPHGWLLNCTATARMPANGFAVALEDGLVLAFDQKSWFRMAHERPSMMSDLMRAVNRQMTRELLNFDKNPENLAGFDDRTAWKNFAQEKDQADQAHGEDLQGTALDDQPSLGTVGGHRLASLPLVKARLLELQSAKALARTGFF